MTKKAKSPASFEGKVKRVKKRDGRIAEFDLGKIQKAVFKAITATGQGDGRLSKKLAGKVSDILGRRFKKDEIPEVEQIQDIVEEVLISENLTETAKAYILYREQRRRLREELAQSEEAVDRVDDYLERVDWEVQENANMSFSLQGLNRYGTSYIIKKYWLNKIYPKAIREAVENNDLHLHNLDTLGLYSFLGREAVVVKTGGRIKLISFRDLYQELAEPEVLLSEEDKAFGKYPEDLFILDRDKWTKVSRMVKKKKVRRMNFVKSEQGRSVIVTDNHPFIIKDEGWEKEVRAEEVREKEDFILSCSIPSLLKGEGLFSKKYLYLAEELLQNRYKNFFLEGFQWEDFVSNWGGSLKAEGTLSTSNNANSLDNKLELTEELGYLVGIFITEGSYDSWKLRISMSEREILERVQRACSRLGARTYISKQEGKVKAISINCSTLKLIFQKVFKIKSLSRNKNLPPDILNYNIDFVKGLIAGIIDGDGTVAGGKGEKRGTQILIRVSSRTMMEQLAILLQFFGVIGRDGVSTEDIGKKHYFKGREIVQNYPLYRLSFSRKKEVDFPSFKYQKAKPATRHWRAEKFDWNKVLKNQFTTIPDSFVYDITTESNTFLCNGLLVHNCAGWDLYDLLKRGFGGALGKVESKPPKHFRAALGQIVNFLYTLQGEVAGAVAFSNFDTLLAPFIRYDNLNYQQVKQAMQEFLFNMAVPTRVGFQTPFSNITLDLKPSSVFADQPVLLGGKPQEATYKEFEEEMKIFDKALYETMLEGDRRGRPFHFPIPTINITKDFPWDDPAFDLIFEASAKYGTNYFANYINSDIKPEDVRSMCCRLKIDLRELQNRGGGGLFGSGSNTGSIGVVTINFPKIGYLSKTKKEFFERLGKLMDLAKDSLEIKRKTVENYIEKGLYPYSRHYLQGTKKAKGKYYINHFSTIGLVGMNEALLNFIGKDIGTKKGRELSLEILDFMRKKLIDFQKETGNIYNLEQTPAESTAYRLAQKDRKQFPDILTAGTEEVPYYTNSTQLPVNYTEDVFTALKLQDEIQCKYTGGSVMHVFLGERLPEVKAAKSLVKQVFTNFHLPYISITPTFSICPIHGYIAGEHFICPKCAAEQPCEVYSRVVGYYRPVKQYNVGKQQEYEERKEFVNNEN